MTGRVTLEHPRKGRTPREGEHIDDDAEGHRHPEGMRPDKLRAIKPGDGMQSSRGLERRMDARPSLSR